MAQQYRGVARRLAGIVVIMLAVDTAATMQLSTNASKKFQEVAVRAGQVNHQDIVKRDNDETAQLVQCIAILVIGISLGIGLFMWGDAASRKLKQENARQEEYPQA